MLMSISKTATRETDSSFLVGANKKMRAIDINKHSVQSKRCNYYMIPQKRNYFSRTCLAHIHRDFKRNIQTVLDVLPMIIISKQRAPWVALL